VHLYFIMVLQYNDRDHVIRGIIPGRQTRNIGGIVLRGPPYGIFKCYIHIKWHTIQSLALKSFLAVKTVFTFGYPNCI